MEVAAAKQLLPMARGPNSPSSSTSSSSPSSAAASPSPRHQQQSHHQPVPPSPKPVPRIIDTTPFPTTFVQADTANFKQVVQRLTGSDTPPPTPPPAGPQKPAKSHGHHHSHHHHHHHGGGGPKKPTFKLYERRIGKNNLKMIAPLAMAAAAAAGASPRKASAPELLSPSVLDFPSLALGSPVTPLQADPFNRSPASASASPGVEDEAAERAAIARKGFFLHPSPRAAEPPRLLPLFPVTSPRMAPAPAAAPSPLQ